MRHKFYRLLCLSFMAFFETLRCKIAMLDVPKIIFADIQAGNIEDFFIKYGEEVVDFVRLRVNSIFPNNDPYIRDEIIGTAVSIFKRKMVRYIINSRYEDLPNNNSDLKIYLKRNIKDAIGLYYRGEQKVGKGGVEEYIVQSGDSLESIAQKKDIEIEYIKLCHHNRCIDDWDNLIEGEKIKIPIKIHLDNYDEQTSDDQSDDNSSLPSPSPYYEYAANLEWKSIKDSRPEQDPKNMKILLELAYKIDPICAEIFRLLYEEGHLLTAKKGSSIEQILSINNVTGWVNILLYLGLPPNKRISNQLTDCLEQMRGPVRRLIPLRTLYKQVRK